MSYLKPDYTSRKQFFMRYYHWSLKTYDCDPAMYMLNYINKRMELNIEQRYWLAWLYANTYNIATAWIIWNEFPDFENVDMERLELWNKENYKRLVYETDNKWQKGHLPAMYKSYKDNIESSGCCTQREFFMSLCGDDENDNFDLCLKFIVKNFFKFGRYLTWFYLQTLRETCDLPVMPRDLLLKDSSSESHRNGLFYALGMEEAIELPFDKEMHQFLDQEADQILSEMRKEYPDIEPDNFTLETTLCAFKKVFRKKHGRYLGFYIDRQAENIKRAEISGFDGVDWDLLWQAREEMLDPRLLRNKVDERRMWHFLDTGEMQLIDWFSGSKNKKQSK